MSVDVILRDEDGDPHVYTVTEGVRLDKQGGGTQDFYLTSGKKMLTDTTAVDVKGFAEAQIDAANIPNLSAENIKKNVQILGTTGSYEGSGGGSVKESWLADFEDYTRGAVYFRVNNGYSGDWAFDNPTFYTVLFSEYPNDTRIVIAEVYTENGIKAADKTKLVAYNLGQSFAPTFPYLLTCEWEEEYPTPGVLETQITQVYSFNAGNADSVKQGFVCTSGWGTKVIYTPMTGMYEEPEITGMLIPSVAMPNWWSWNYWADFWAYNKMNFGY